MKPERPHSYLQTMMQPRQRRIQMIQILLALAVLAALILTRPAPSQRTQMLGGAAQSSAFQADWTSLLFDGNK